jgi:asparagine synthase (glutamine-hydrolysing)
MTENGICGWVSFSASSGQDPAICRRMLRAATGESATRHDLAGRGEAFTYGPAPDRWFAQHQGVAVVVKGRPRWRERAADDSGVAAAVLEAYARHGRGFLSQVHGQFALLVIDTHRTEALLAIDRAGIERLCIARVGNALAFGTSAKAVARYMSADVRLNHQAIFDYLYREIVPSPETVFASVEKLMPGECATFDGKALRREFYWRLRYRPRDAASLQELESRFRTLLREAVARDADRDDVGAFLSGGTDSSTVTGMLTDLRGRPVRTFSIGFSADGYDEMAYARVASRHFGADAHEYYVTPNDVAQALPLIAQAYDEPFGNASAVPTYFCARLAREHGVGLLLAGDGGDEIFGGNARYAKQMLFERYAGLPGIVRRFLDPALLSLPGATLVPLLRKLQSYVRQARIPLPDRLETYNFLHRNPLDEVFEAEFLRDVDPERPIQLLREVFLRTESEEAVDRMMHLDLKFILADSDLRKVGRMCEIAGVDVRFPMLADELVEFSGELPSGLKVKGTRLRFFFKHALRDFLPAETLSKSKHGFGLPFGMWLASDRALADQTRTALQELGGRGIVRAEYIKELWRQHAHTDANYFGVMLWILTQLELWLRHHVDGTVRSG